MSETESAHVYFLKELARDLDISTSIIERMTREDAWRDGVEPGTLADSLRKLAGMLEEMCENKTIVAHCTYCGESMLTSELSLETAAEHVKRCPMNPVAVENDELRTWLSRMRSVGLELTAAVLTTSDPEVRTMATGGAHALNGLLKEIQL